MSTLLERVGSGYLIYPARGRESRRTFPEARPSSRCGVSPVCLAEKKWNEAEWVRRWPLGGDAILAGFQGPSRVRGGTLASCPVCDFLPVAATSNLVHTAVRVLESDESFHVGGRWRRSMAGETIWRVPVPGPFDNRVG